MVASSSCVSLRLPNGALLPTAQCGVRQAGAALAHVARPAASCWRR